MHNGRAASVAAEVSGTSGSGVGHQRVGRILVEVCVSGERNQLYSGVADAAIGLELRIDGSGPEGLSEA